MRGANRRSGVARLDLAFQRVNSLLIQNPALQKLLFKSDDGIDGFPRGLFVASAIFVARVAQGVAEVAVGVHVEEVRPLSFAAALGWPQDGVACGQHVHAVDNLRVHAVVGKAGGALGQVADPRHFVVGPAGHGVVIVENEKDNRHAEAPVAGNFIGKLRLGRPIQRFQNHAVAVSAIPGKATHHAAVLPVAQTHCRAGGDGHAAAHNGVRAQMADREVRNVHAAAAPPAIAILFAEQLRDGAIDMLFQSLIEKFLVTHGLRVRNALPQLLIRHVAQGAASARQAVAVAAVRAGDVILQDQGAARSHGSAFLPDGDVRGTAIIETRQRLVGAGPHRDDHFLQLADHQHVFQQPDGRGSVDAPRREFALKVSLETKCGNRSAIDLKGSKVRS